MTSTIKLKKSSVAAKVPQVADLAYGELALNYADGKLYFKNSSNEIVNFNDSAQTVDLVLNTINKGLDYVDLNADSAAPAYAEGRLYYSDEYKALTYRNDISDVSLQVGLEEWIRVYNDTGSTITNGTPVYATGANGETATVAPADATTEMKARVLGIATHDIANASEGVVTVRGLVSGIDTSHLTAGQPIHVAADGSIQTLAPTYPYFPTDLGGCVVSDSSDGYIYVDIEVHTYEQFRVTGNQHIGGSLTVEGDLTVTGTQSVVSQSNLAVDNSFIYTNSGNTIGVDNTNFTGSGLDDAIFTGHYSGTTSNKTYYVRIDGTGTPDTFEWSLDNFSTTEATDIAITGADQELEDGININFNATTGHTLNDTWDGEASPVNVDAGFSSNRNTGGTGVGYTHMGMFFDVSDEKWKLFKSYDPEPEGTIDTGDASYEKATLDANLTGNVTGNLTGDVTGNATTATALETSRNFSVSGDVTASAVSFNGTGNVTLNAAITAGSIVNSDINASAAIADTKLATISTSGKVSNSATTATDANTNSAIVARDASGNFSAGTITADLIGNATTATTLETARTIGGVSFNGSTNINLPGVNTAGNQNTSGNAATATALATGRNFSVSGDATTSAPVSFDGTGNVDLGITLSNSGVSSGSYGSSSLVPVITVDAKGRITSLTTTTVDASGVTGITYDSATGQFILQTEAGNLATTITLDPFTTADLTENTNLYYTTSRANSAIDARVTKSFVDALNVDADTLDGQQGSYYLDGNNFINLPAGYTGWTVSDGTNSETIADGNSLVFSGAGATDVSYNTASNTLTLTTSASDILTQIKTVDGSASGLDADLLDGQQGSYYTTYADNAIANLVASAPGTLDTLNELAAALGDDPNFATTVTNSIATKLALTGGTLSGDLNLGGNDIDDVGTITGSLNGNATTATTLQTARTIGGVSFNGSSNINLPGVNTVGNQNTTGSAATLTTARTIGGVSFNGSSNINLPGVNTTGNQDTTGNAATATILATGRNFSASGDATASAVSFNGSSNVNLALTLANSGVTAGSYGSGTSVPVITVDSKGRLTSVTTSAIAGVTGLDFDSSDGQVTVATTGGDFSTVVTLDPFTTNDLTENTNLYYTTARANSAIDARVTQSFVNALNVDADTLDGENGSYYLDGNNFINLPAGYGGWTVSDGTNSENIADGNTLEFVGAGATDVSYNTSSNTLTVTTSASDILTQIKTVDGTSSGLDADLLDGQQGSYYTTYADNAVANLVASAPGTLDTLNELAAALGDDPNFATTVTNSIATKLALTGGTLSGDLNLGGNDIDNAGTITGALSGNATTATTLQTARTIGGVSFNGSANINLPGVNTLGNQNTTGSAATLTTARTIGGVSFDGSANINLPGVNTTGNQDTTGSAATLTTPRDIGGVSFDGSGNIDLPGVNYTGNQDTTGNAATATTLASGVLIGLSGDVTANGVEFDGGLSITLTTNIASGVVGATELNVTGNGTTAQFLRSDGDGSFTWATPTNTTYSAGTALDLVGTTFNVDLTELAASLTNADGDYFVVTDITNGTQKQLLKSAIQISGFDNDAGYTSYSNSSVDTHLNTSTATTDQVLAWSGSDYNWVDASGGISFVRKTTTYTAAANEGIVADTSSGAWTLSLPSTPADGTQVIVADGGSWAANNLTINRNGSTIEGVADNYLLDVSGAQVQFIYVGSTWQVYSNPGVVNSTDSFSIINSSGTTLKTIYSA